jgi:hypothetical protein
MVMIGGVCLLVAASLVALVRDVGVAVPQDAVIVGDRDELLGVPESAQPVPSAGLTDRDAFHVQGSGSELMIRIKRISRIIKG